MQRQRGELVPVREALSGLGGTCQRTARSLAPGVAPLHPLRSGEPACRGQRSGPRSRLHGAAAGAVQPAPHQPGNRLQYKRVNGPYQLYMIAGGGNKLPFGNIPRLLLAWVTTEAVRTQSRELILGSSLSEFMGKLGMDSVGGRSNAPPQPDEAAL